MVSKTDIFNWTKLSLHICKVNGSDGNNIISDLSTVHHGQSIDNFMVFKDTNPNCGDDKRYKAILRLGDDGDDGFTVCSVPMEYILISAEL